MRADRLLSLLLLLQTRGRMTAARLAQELEVSIRTIYRDFYALRVAGFPVSTEPGRDGGCYLEEDYRIDLTGLTASERRALFALGVPTSLSELGLGPALQRALLKLAGTKRSTVDSDRERIVIDSVPWTDARAPTPHLQTLQEAVWSDRLVDATFLRVRSIRVQHRIAPYGLVAKALTWYVVWAAPDGGIHADSVSSIVDATLTDVMFQRPKDFDLTAWWSKWRAGYEKGWPAVPVTLKVATDALPYLVERFAAALAILDADGGRTTISITFGSVLEARGQLLAYGGAVEVLAPPSLRLSMADFAERIRERYT